MAETTMPATAGGSTTAFNDLEIACMVSILSRLSPQDCGRAACVCALWAEVAADDVLWQPHLATDFAASSCVGPGGNVATSYKAAYGAWRHTYADVAGPLLARALAAWALIKAWLAAHSPRILETLNPGASPHEVAEAERALGGPLPQAMRCLYRVHNGQALTLTQDSCEEGPPRDLLNGLFGCLVFYDHVTSNRLLPLDDVVQYTRMLRRERPLGAQHPLLAAREVCYAASWRVLDKLCVVDCDTGAVAFKMPHRDWPLTPPQDSYPNACDGLLRWCEEYARRLTSGWYGTCEAESSLANAGLDVRSAISLFPRAHPMAATAITRGIKVTWSAVIVPQESRSGRLMFAYSVRFSMLTPEQEAAVLGHELPAQQAAWQQHQQQQRRRQQLGCGQEPGEPGGGKDDDAGSGGLGGDVTMTDAPAGAAEHATPGAAAAQPATAAGADAAGPAAVAAAAEPREGVAPPQPVQHRRSPHAAPGGTPPRQVLVLGPCSAAAGDAAVPPPLAVRCAWGAAPAVAGASSVAGGQQQQQQQQQPRPSAAVSSAGGVGRSTTRSLAAGGGSNSSGGGGGTAAAAGGSGGGGSSGVVPASCQLESRHWAILDTHGSVTERVDGEGVVGRYPLLYPGSEVFAYASCTAFPVPQLPPEVPAVPAVPAAATGPATGTAAASSSSAAAAAAAASGNSGGGAGAGVSALPPHTPAAVAAAFAQQQQRQQQGSAGQRWAAGPGRLAGCVLGMMEGSFSFVEGSLMQRAGGVIDVACPRLVFAVPEFIY